MAKLTQAELKRYVVSEILVAAQEISTPVKEMPPEEVDALRYKLAKIFGVDPNYQLHFENMSGKVSIQDEDGWQLLSNFLKSGVHYMFYDHSCDFNGMEVFDGSKIPDILERCFGFPFYVTDKENNFVVGMNDHDFLIAVGSAAVWLQEYKDGTAR